ncbi:MAG: DUF2189 domain-containing protein [Rudaea sp.]
MTPVEPRPSALPAVRRVGARAPLQWLAAGARDFGAHPLPSLFYGACFAAMGWIIAFTFRHAYEYVAALVTGFFLVGPFLAVGLYDLSRRHERGEAPRLGPTLCAWRANAGALGVFTLVLTIILLVWARASLIAFALFYEGTMPTVAGFVDQMLSLDNVEFLLAYACVGGFFAALTFASSVVAAPLMLDRGTDGIVAVLTSLRAFGANVPAMLVWGVAIVVIVGLGFALAFAGLVVAVPWIGHATWHAYRALVE